MSSRRTVARGRRSWLGPLDGGLAALRPPSVNLVAYGGEHEGLHGLPGPGGFELGLELHVVGNFSQVQSNHALSLARDL
jgi:hypothetical protein